MDGNKKELLEKTKEWMRDLNELPYSFFSKLYETENYNWENITGIMYSDEIETDIQCPEYDAEGNPVDQDTIEELDTGFTGTVSDIDLEEREYLVKVDGYACEYVLRIPFDDAALCERHATDYPCTRLWSFKHSFGDEWIRSHVDEVSACGFIIFDHAEEGIFLGLFAENSDLDEYFVPLYQMMS